MATIRWGGTTSTDAEVAANWQDGIKPGTGDDVVFNGTASGACQLTANVSWQSCVFASTWNQNFDLNSKVLTSAGNIHINGTSAVTFSVASPGKFVVSGDADFLVGNTNANCAISGNPDVDLQGTGEWSSYVTSFGFERLTCAASGKTTSYLTGNKQAKANKLTMGSGTFHNTYRVFPIWCSVTADVDLAVGHSFTGDKSFEFRNNTADAITFTNGINANSTTLIRLYSNNASSHGFILGGNVSAGTFEVYNHAGNTSDSMVDFNDKNVTVEKLVIGSGNAGDEMTVWFGSGTIDIAGDFETTTFNGSPLYLMFETATVRVGGSIAIGSNSEITPGTASIEMDGATAATITSAGEEFPDLTINKSGNGVTLVDALTCGDFTHTDGNFSMATFTLNCVDLTITSADTKTYNATVTSTGNQDIDVSVTISRLDKSSSTTHTQKAGTTFTLTNYTSGDMNSTTMLSDASGSSFTFANPASMTVTGCTFKDTSASNEIDATDASNTDSGGNTNIDFGVAPSGIIPKVDYNMRRRRMSI